MWFQRARGYRGVCLSSEAARAGSGCSSEGRGALGFWGWGGDPVPGGAQPGAMLEGTALGAQQCIYEYIQHIFLLCGPQVWCLSP